jgi:hypothetical protein
VNFSLTKAIWKLSNDKNVRYFVKTAYFIEDENDEDEITHACCTIQVHWCCGEKLPTSFGTGIPCSLWTR